MSQSSLNPLRRRRRKRSFSPIPVRLSFYVLGRFVFYVAVVLAVFAVLAYFGALTELLRRASGPGASFWIIAGMALLQIPTLLEVLLPLTFLVSAMLCFISLTRSQEAIIARGTGLSLLTLMLPVLAASLVAGGLFITLVNPAGTLLTAQFERMEARYIKNRVSITALLEAGLWLRTAEADGTISVVHALEAGAQGRSLQDATLLVFDPQGKLLRRVDAEQAVLNEGQWLLRDARAAESGEHSVYHRELVEKTLLTPIRIQESLTSPKTISFWGLSRFIALAEAAGFATIEHRVYYYQLLTLPIFLVATALLGAALTIFYIPRITRGIDVVLAGGLSGFGLLILTSFFETLGLGGGIPPFIAVSSPALIAACAGMGLALFGEA